MVSRKLGLFIDGCFDSVKIDVSISDDIKIPETAINKALMIAMNYLLENMETTEHEEPE